ncbi:MAG: VWA domain-containing protein [Gammaproteobacteria bacterium]|nr:VWA domain-containing protein [Gammaproteobacteria bacterium]
MYKPLFAITLFAATATAVALHPAAEPAPPGPRPVTPVTPVTPLAEVRAPRIEVVFALDTTGSMGGLIDAAKEKIWSIAASMAQAEPAPEIRMGLVAYRDHGDSYVTRTVDLSSDLDSVYARLMDFQAGGGGDHAEAVNEALHEAVDGMSWSADGDVYRVVFLVGDAPPHMDYANAPRYPEIIERARARGIVVNAIQCGNDGAARAAWTRIAALAQGDFFNVAQDGNAVAVATPFDDRLAELAAAMDETRLFFGDAATRARLADKDAATAKLKAAASPAALARRATFNASASGAANLGGEADLVEAVASGRVDLAEVAPAALPEPLQALSAAERAAEVAAAAEKRAAVKREITELAAERDRYIADELEARGGAEDSLDSRLYDTVRRQAADIGLEYGDGARF